MNSSSGRGGPAEQVGLTPRSKRVIELAIKEARRHGHTAIGSGHLLVALLREGEGVAAGVLESMGVRFESVIDEVLAELSDGKPEAADDAPDVSTKRRSVSSGSPWEARIGFSRAVRVGDRIVVSGTAPIWPDGSCDPDPERQARRCLEIIEAALTEAGASLRDVIRTRTYLTSADDAEAVARAHEAAFGDIRPASTMVVVAGFLDPRWKVEFEAEAQLS